jgi:hypothetical protein
VVIGIEVHEDILYVGFQGIGVHSYTMVCVHVNVEVLTA